MSYRGVVRHVRFWRGAVHRWSTVYQFVGTPSTGLAAADAKLLLDADNKMLYSPGASKGGTFECALYDQATGGVPIAVYTAFDWTTPGSWLAGSASAWGTSTGPPSSPAETALLVEWPAGLSSSGKPVTLRKWYHQVAPVSVPSTSPDVDATTRTALVTAATGLVSVLSAKGLVLGSASGRFAGSPPTVDNYYANHQMPRGRRRRVTSEVKAASNYQAILQFIEGKAQPAP